VLVIIYNAAATAAIPADDVVPEEVLPQAKAGTTRLQMGGSPFKY